MNKELLLFGAIAIVGLAEWFKTFDGEDKLKKWYNLLPLIIALPVAVVLVLQEGLPWYTTFIYWGLEVSLSVLGYTTIIQSVKKLTQAK